MKHLLSESLLNETTTTADVPEHCRRYRIAGAKPVYTEGRFGFYFSQEIKVDDYRIWYYIYSIRQRITLPLIIEIFSAILHYILEGRVTCRIAGISREIEVRQGRYQLSLLTPGLVHEITLEPDLHRSLHIGIPNQPLLDLAGQYPHFNTLLHMDQEVNTPVPLFRINKRIQAVIEEIVICREEKAKEQMYLLERVLGLLNRYLEDTDTHRRRLQLERSTLNLNDLEAYILAHLEIPDYKADNPLTLKRLAKSCGMTPTSFHAAYSRHYKMPLDNLVAKLRVEQAMKILKNSSHTVTEIAEMVGYTEKTNLTRAFKRHYGHPPSFYRKK